jgi:hypothetical protein
MDAVEAVSLGERAVIQKRGNRLSHGIGANLTGKRDFPVSHG